MLRPVTTPARFVAALAAHRTCAIVRATTLDVARRAMQAAVDGGVRICEFTLSTPGALDLIAAFGERTGRDGATVIVGAGTVLTIAELRDAVAAGARFVVSPVFDPEIVAAARDADVAVHTPTEMLAAHRAGATLLKLFPAPAGGPAWLRAVLAPLPFLSVVPTHGVTLDNVEQWLDAGAFAVGLVGDVFRPEWLAAGDFAAVQARVAAVRARVEARVTASQPRAVDSVG